MRCRQSLEMLRRTLDNGWESAEQREATGDEGIKMNENADRNGMRTRAEGQGKKLRDSNV